MTGVVWPVLLGVLVTGYLILDGGVFGVGMVLGLCGRAHRGGLRAVAGPYFLGNEVWVVAAAGLLAGGFPDLEGAVLARHAPLVVLLLGSLLLRDGAMWFRGRHVGARWHTLWDSVLAAASTGSALGWGWALGLLVAPGAAPVAAVGFAVLLGCHGAVFAALRGDHVVRARVRRLAARLAVAAAVLVAATAVLVGVTADPRYPVVSAVLAAAAVLALVVAGWTVRRSGAGWALAATTAAVGLVVAAAGAGQLPALTAGLGQPATLRALEPFLLAALPLMAGAQVWLWCAFRGPARAVYF